MTTTQTARSIPRVRPAGLTEAEAARRLRQCGPNAVRGRRLRRLGSEARWALADPLVLVLAGAFALSLLTGDGILLGITLALSVAARIAYRVLSHRPAPGGAGRPMSRLVRGGRTVMRPARTVVPGDVLLLEAGDVVPADARLVDSDGIEVEDGSSSGDLVPAGSVVVSGRGTAVVVRTGGNAGTAQAAVASRAAPAAQAAAPLARMHTGLLALTVTLAALGFLSGLLRGRPAAETLSTVVTVALASVPLLLPVVVLFALRAGAREMSAHAARVNRLADVETIGSVTAVAMDPTGTLTEGSLTAERVWAGGEWYSVTGPPNDASGTVLDRNGAPPQRVPVELAVLLRDLVLGAAADPRRPTHDPAAAALVALAAKGGVLAGPARAAYPLEISVPGARRRRTAVHATVDPQRRLIVCQGTPRALFDPPGLVDDERVGTARSHAARLATEGYGVIAVADRLVSAPVAAADAERGLRLAGLVALTDPVRSHASAVVDSFRDTGVELLLVSGEHQGTARMLATRLGLRRSAVVTGPDVIGGGRRRSPQDSGRTFAPSRPEQKAQLVRALQEHGHVVATAGGEVGDTPALRHADVGAAFADGAAAARQAADVLLDRPDLRALADAVAAGRRVHARVRRFVRHAATGALATAFVILCAPFVGLAGALAPSQVLWLNAIVLGLPGLSLPAGREEPGVPGQGGQRPLVTMLRSGLWWRIAVTGALVAAVGLTAGYAGQAMGWAGGSLTFLVLGVSLLGAALALPARTTARSLNRFRLSLALALALHLCVLLTPLRDWFGLQPLGVPAVLAGLLAATLPGLLLRAVR